MENGTDRIRTIFLLNLEIWSVPYSNTLTDFNGPFWAAVALLFRIVLVENENVHLVYLDSVGWSRAGCAFWFRKA